MFFNDLKPGYNLIDLFIAALKEKYMVKIYTPREDYMEIIIKPYESRDDIVLGINSIKKFNIDLFFYINALNNYYINIRKMSMPKTLNDMFRDTLLGISLEEMLDYNAYLEKLTEQLFVTMKKDKMLEK